MPRIEPMGVGDETGIARIISDIGRDHGYVPNSFLTMGRIPAILMANGRLTDALWYHGKLELKHRSLVSFAFSMFSGAMYSAAHTGCLAEECGLAKEKLLRIAEFETADIFTPVERALLRLCRNAARMPGEVTDADMDELKRHFDEAAIVSIVGLIAWHAFLNRWNGIIGTRLEAKPRAFAEQNLTSLDWTVWPHG